MKKNAIGSSNIYIHTFRRYNERDKLVECPKLEKHFPKVDTPHFAIFKVKIANA